MAVSPAAAVSLNRSSIKSFANTVTMTANAIPDAVRQGGNATAMKIKPRWYGIAQSHGISASSRIGRTKWRVSDSVKGKTTGTGTVLISYDGNLHLIVGKNKPHIIGAKLLGTRNSIKSKAGRLGAGTAFGGSNRGVFGAKHVYVNYNRYGSTRQQALKGVLRRRTGAHALTIGANLRAYAFHPGGNGDRSLWEESKRVAIIAGPQLYAAEMRKSLAKNYGKAAGGLASSAVGGI